MSRESSIEARLSNHSICKLEVACGRTIRTACLALAHVFLATTTLGQIQDSQPLSDSESFVDEYFQLLFESPNDFQLVNSLFGRISHKVDGSDVQVLQQLPRQHRVLLDVWGAGGIIGNGGFRYLFESGLTDLPGILSSYEALGVPGATNAFRKAMTVFPSSLSLADVSARWEYVQELSEADQQKLAACSLEMFAADREVKRALAEYVRKNRDAFRSLQPTPWEDIDELKKRDLPPPPANAPEDQVIAWLDSIGASYIRNQELQSYASNQLRLPQDGNPIVQIALDDHRRSTDQELEQLTKYSVLDSLCVLDLGETEVTENGIRQLEHFKNLQKVALVRTDIKDDWLIALTKLRQLADLDLALTEVSDRGVASLREIPSLTRLSLRHTPVSDVACVHLGDVHCLQDLNLSATQVTNAGLAALTGLPLEVLYLNETQTGDKGLECLSKIASLKSLRLDDTTVTDAGLLHLQNLVSLENLNLENTPLVGDCFSDLGTWQKLESLNLWGTRIDDEALRHISKLSALKNLTLSRTLITDAGIPHLSALTMLEQLGLTGIPFEGGTAWRKLDSLQGLTYVSLPPKLEGNRNILYLQARLPEADFYFY